MLEGRSCSSRKLLIKYMMEYLSSASRPIQLSGVAESQLICQSTWFDNMDDEATWATPQKNPRTSDDCYTALNAINGCAVSLVFGQSGPWSTLVNVLALAVSLASD